MKTTLQHILRLKREYAEDDHHWPWYLEDFVKLGHDSPRPPSELMRALYSEATGHAMNNDHAALAGMALDDATRRRAIECADQVFAWFEGWTRELHRYALAQLGETVEAIA